MTDRPVVTRFAPSPTGALHIGGARTALFSWAFARRHGGRFVLRIEDTDARRSSPQSTRGILRDLQWLGIEWDEGPQPDATDPYGTASQTGKHGPYFQSQRLKIYTEQIKRLIDAGTAYEDDGAVRFRMDKDITFDDAVYGRVQVAASELEDFVIRKADGFPTFHMAVVVDDGLMGVTHVIRGQEHLSNTSKHVALQDALGFERPVYCHTPSIMNPDGSKMSKRDKAKVARKGAGDAGVKQIENIPADVFDAFMARTSDDLTAAIAIAESLGLTLPEVDVADFRRSGYIPAALMNYIALLGWSPKDADERFDVDWFVEHFNLEGVNKANAKFDRDKLAAFNGDRLQHMSSQDFATSLRTHMEHFHANKLAQLGDHFAMFAAAYQPRSKTLEDPITQGGWLFSDAVDEYNGKPVKKNLTKNDGEGLAVLDAFRGALAAHDDWSAESLHKLVEDFTAEKQLKNMGSVAQPLRVALTGNAVSPPIDQTLVLMGKQRTLQRIDDCLNAHGNATAS